MNSNPASEVQPRKRKKQTVTFSQDAKLRKFTDDHELQDYSPWLTEDEVSSMMKRAKKLATLHYLKTRPGQHAPSTRSGIVYNCHPAHYEIIGESLRGMEHLTDMSKARSRKRLQSGAMRLAEELQNQCSACKSSVSCKYVECTKEAMEYSMKIAEEDARTASAILTEDLKQQDGVVSISSLIQLRSSEATVSPCIVTDFPDLSRILSPPQS